MASNNDVTFQATSERWVIKVVQKEISPKKRM